MPRSAKQPQIAPNIFSGEQKQSLHLNLFIISTHHFPSEAVDFAVKISGDAELRGDVGLGDGGG